MEMLGLNKIRYGHEVKASNLSFAGNGRAPFLKGPTTLKIGSNHV